MGKKWGHFKKWNTSVQESFKILVERWHSKGYKNRPKNPPVLKTFGGVYQNWILIVKFQKVRLLDSTIHGKNKKHT